MDSIGLAPPIQDACGVEGRDHVVTFMLRQVIKVGISAHAQDVKCSRKTAVQLFIDIAINDFVLRGPGMNLPERFRSLQEVTCKRKRRTV